ncbi:uncharacterized protein LOC144352204, partial [Saccoglossus kowalevskii]
MAANYDLAMIEEALRTVENVDEPRSCKCKGARMRKHGRESCPCKTWDELCNDACSCGKHRPTLYSIFTLYMCSCNFTKLILWKSMDSTSEDLDGAEDAVAEFVSGLPRERLEHIILELFRRQPGACADLVLQEGSDPTISNPPPDPQPVPKPNETTRPWCKCGQC